MDEANRLALSAAMELAGRAQGPAWGAEAIVAAAVKLRGFLDGEPEAITVLRSHAEAINELYARVDLLDKPGSSRTKRAATNTTPPKPDALDVPEPVDF